MLLNRANPGGLMTNETVWKLICQAGDGSDGDVIVDLPDTVLARLNWLAGDTLRLDIQEDRSVLVLKVLNPDITRDQPANQEREALRLFDD